MRMSAGKKKKTLLARRKWTIAYRDRVIGLGNGQWRTESDFVDFLQWYVTILYTLENRKSASASCVPGCNFDFAGCLCVWGGWDG